MHLLLTEYCCVHATADPLGQALLHEGWGMLRALIEDLLQSRSGHLTLLAGPLLESQSRTFPEVDWIATRPETEMDLLAQLAPRVDASLVIAPECHGLLFERVSAVLDAGGRSLNCDPEFIRIASDKSATNSLILPTVRWSPELEWNQYPAVVKPIDGAGSQATFLVLDRDELVCRVREASSLGWPDLIVQPYLEGTSASVVRLAGAHGQMCPATEQVISTDGRFQYLGARYPLLIQEPLAYASGSDMRGRRGWIGTDYHVATGAVFDINPRMTTSYLALRQRCRSNLADAMVRIALGESLPTLEWDDTPLEFRIE